VLLSKFLDQGPLKVLPQFHPFPKSWTADSKGRDEAAGQAPKQIVVVARDRQKLFEYAKRAFTGNSSVEVVLDRRRAERRSGERASSPDRRRGDRRLMNEIDNHLRALGWAVVRLDVFRTLGLTRRSEWGLMPPSPLLARKRPGAAVALLGNAGGSERWRFGKLAAR
jgi:hypothetical protein